MSDIHDHYDHGSAVRKEPVDGGMKIVAYAVAWVLACVALALVPAACGAGWR